MRANTLSIMKSRLLVGLGLRLSFDKAKIFFVVTTGRSGSQTIAEALSQHPDIECEHEPHPELIRLSTEYAHGEKSADAVREELRGIYSRRAYPRNKWVGESDQKYWNLIPFLAELMPHSKFIWLIRDGRDVVASTYARGWFADDESSIAEKKHAVRKMWELYRLNGWKCGCFTEAQWKAMSVFDRNCWYWSHVNSQAETLLSALGRDRCVKVNLEALHESTCKIWEVLKIRPLPVSVPKANRSRRDVTRWVNWSASEISSFERICGSEMDKGYPAWRLELKKSRSSKPKSDAVC